MGRVKVAEGLTMPLLLQNHSIEPDRTLLLSHASTAQGTTLRGVGEREGRDQFIWGEWVLFDTAQLERPRHVSQKNRC